MTDLRSAAVPPLSDEDHLRGAPGAALVIVYADFSCPRCALAHARLRDAPLRVAFRHFALRARDPRAPALACAAEAAALQGSFWEMHDSLLCDQGHLDDPHLWERARELGLELDRFESDRRHPDLAARVARDVTGALRAGVTVTPTLVVDGRLHPGSPTLEFVRALRDPRGAAAPR